MFIIFQNPTRTWYEFISPSQQQVTYPLPSNSTGDCHLNSKFLFHSVKGANINTEIKMLPEDLFVAATPIKQTVPHSSLFTCFRRPRCRINLSLELEAVNTIADWNITVLWFGGAWAFLRLIRAQWGRIYQPAFYVRRAIRAAQEAGGTRRAFRTFISYSPLSFQNLNIASWLASARINVDNLKCEKILIEIGI